MNEERSGLLLAGGRSLRMGQDKAFLLWQGRPLWQRQAELLHEAGLRHWRVSCRREQELEKPVAAWSEAHGMRVEMLYDPQTDHGGMMEALARGLETVATRTLVLSVDMPRVTAALILQLWTKAGADSGGCVFTNDAGPEPFPGIYTRAMLPALTETGGALRAGLERCLMKGLASAIPASENVRACLANWNRPSDVED